MSQLWEKANRNLIAKSIAELSYEGILFPQGLTDKSDYGQYELSLKSGARYSFKAWQTLWDFLRICPESLKRTSPASSEELSAGQFYIDAQTELEMSDLNLAPFLEEMHSTLMADVDLLEKTQSLSSEEISSWSGDKVQSILNGHPKILLNKGRLGWGFFDRNTYSPESGKKFSLIWLATAKNKTLVGLSKNLNLHDLYQQSLSEDELMQFKTSITKNGKDFSDYYFMPVHPWQWDRVIQLHYAGDIQNKNIIYLGKSKTQYTPQISLRTLSHTSSACYCDIKLSLSILNTSAIRGISSRHIISAPHIAESLNRLCQSDAFLQSSNTHILAEKAGMSFEHPLFKQIQNAPYRYHETLGVIWRESVASKLKPGEMGILTGSLFHQDQNGNSLIGAYIKKSGLNIEQWLELYFEKVVLPLYHLQLKCGIGLVAHGQNIVLRLKNFKPHGLLLKDFQGDLRLSKKLNMKFSEVDILSKHLEQLPAEYLIHDLITGHFVTVLRFISATLSESDSFAEQRFYALLAKQIQIYLDQHHRDELPEYADLLQKKLHRVLVNKVRFQIGYSDSASRPKPLVGEDLSNPLYISQNQEFRL